jgi:hypothetical protein
MLEKDNSLKSYLKSNHITFESELLTRIKKIVITQYTNIMKDIYDREIRFY